MGIMEREAAAEAAELVSLREDVAGLRAANEALRGALEDACDAEREAVMYTGRADATARLMALALREGRLDVAEGIADMVLDKHNPKVIAEMREAKDGVRAALVGWPVEMLIRAMAEEIEAVGAKNYLEWPVTITGIGFALRIERVEGKSPATVAAEAVRERDEARAALTTVTAERDRLQRACDEGLPREYLECPACGRQHIEGPRHDNPALDGRTRPHHTHRCYGCGHVWDAGRWSFGADVPKGDDWRGCPSAAEALAHNGRTGGDCFGPWLWREHDEATVVVRMVAVCSNDTLDIPDDLPRDGQWRPITRAGAFLPWPAPEAR